MLNSKGDKIFLLKQVQIIKLTDRKRNIDVGFITNIFRGILKYFPKEVCMVSEEEIVGIG